mmetsp:Transcript_15673/g.33857  ORF Transcript_15673/g.33857 Transcript_15673/m.33857 type:complete len:236 (+) Transcript_15673:1255-1962(+)
MPTSIGILSTKDRSNLKDTFKATTSRSHLFVELRTHTQTSRFAKVIQGKDISASLTCTRKYLGSVNLDKVLFEEIFTKQRAHHGLDAKDTLIGRSTKIDPTVIKASLLSNTASLRSCIRFMIVSTDISLFDKVRTTSILHLERHGCSCFLYTMVTVNLNLNIRLRCSLHCLFRTSKYTGYIHNRLYWNTRHVLDHGRWDFNFVVSTTRFKSHTLNGVQRRTEHHECSLSNSPRGM